MNRRSLLAGGAGLVALQSVATLASAAASRPLQFRWMRLSDPDGHSPALRLRGDWLIVAVTDGDKVGYGEISHSNDDEACAARAQDLFQRHVAALTDDAALDLAGIAALDQGPFLTAPDLVTATAISGLNQALLELLAQQRQTSVWRLLRPDGPPVQQRVACYMTLNRFLRERTDAAYLRAVDAALALGAQAVKCAPFEAVTPQGDQIAQAQQGFARLEAIRRAHPNLSLRVDCHERFGPESAAALLGRFKALNLTWVEEPIPTGPALGALRARSQTAFSVGELFFRERRFREIVEARWADVIMPDPKHVGGFMALLDVCRMAKSLGASVSPHNPSGPVAGHAALQTMALSPAVSSLELVLTSDPLRQPCRELISDGTLSLPEGNGWGLPDRVLAELAKA